MYHQNDCTTQSESQSQGHPEQDIKTLISEVEKDAKIHVEIYETQNNKTKMKQRKQKPQLAQ